MKNTQQIITELVSQVAVSGYEWELGMASVIQQLIGTSGKRIGNNLVYTLGKGKNNLFISAHMDEVGFIITNSSQNFCRILPVGDIPIENVVNKRLGFVIDGKTVYSQPIQSASSFTELNVMGLKNPPIGSIGTFEKKCNKRKNLLCSPSVDNKTGCAALILLYDRLKMQELPITVTLCFSSKEEIGVNGVMSAVKECNPDLCIDIDSAYANSKTESFPPNWCIPEMEKGPALQLLGDEFIISDRYRRYVERVANENTIPIQYEIPDSRSGGTNSKALQNNGYETIQVNIPVADQHSAESCVSLIDIESTAELLYQIIMNDYTLFDLI